jgi:hypothetical protein
MAGALGVEVMVEEAPFQDHVGGTEGTGCQVMATGTGMEFDMAMFDILRGMLESEGWQEDMQRGGGGPTGLLTGFRRGAGLCMLVVGWEPSDDANCPDDQPIVACDLAPEQQLYTVTLDCAQEAEMAELMGIATTDLPPTPTPDAEGFAPGGIVEVGALPLIVSDDSQPLWAVFSVGGRSFTDPPQNHFVAIYARGDAGWEELARVELGEGGTDEMPAPGPDYVFPGSVVQAHIEPNRIWLEVHGGVGAHSGTYHLLSFDGQVLTIEAAGFSSSPGAAGLEDLNSDGVLEVLLDASDYYVFCYACGVRLVNYSVLRWDGSHMVEVALVPLTESAPAALRDLNNRAVELAQAGLWKDALATIEQALALGGQDETVVWNSALIRRTTEARMPGAGGSSPYPLLDFVFYGEYAGAVDLLRAYSVEELFGQPNPLVAGTVAEGFEAELVGRIQDGTTQALQVQPDLAAAWFLRGWATHLADPGSPEALADIERAAELDPDEPLYAQSVAHLK